jgi:DNA-binding MarR family transcriptional regulator
MLARMERDGVIRREPNPEDGRESLSSLTQSSHLRWPKAKTALIRAEHEAMAGFSPAERELLLSLLQRVVSNLEGEGAADGG